MAKPKRGEGSKAPLKFMAPPELEARVIEAARAEGLTVAGWLRRVVTLYVDRRVHPDRTIRFDGQG